LAQSKGGRENGDQEAKLKKHCRADYRHYFDKRGSGSRADAIVSGAIAETV